MKRVALGTLGGALFGGLVGAAIPSLLFGTAILFVEAHPIDRERDLAQFPYVVAFCAISGMIVGALAGFASRITASGVPFLRCCMLIAVAAGIARFITFPRPKVSEADQYYFSYIASVTAAVIVACILVWIGLYCERTADHEGRPTPHTH